MEMARPVTGLSASAIGMFSGAITRVSASATPSMARRRSTTASGARLRATNTSAKACSSYTLRWLWRSASSVVKDMTYMATPAATMTAIAMPWPLSCQISRRSLRWRAFMCSPVKLVGAQHLVVVTDTAGLTVTEADGALRHVADHGVVGDDNSRGAETLVEILQHFEHTNASG